MVPAIRIPMYAAKYPTAACCCLLLHVARCHLGQSDCPILYRGRDSPTLAD
jgi:hypothetical protein